MSKLKVPWPTSVHFATTVVVVVMVVAVAKSILEEDWRGSNLLEQQKYSFAAK